MPDLDKVLWLKQQNPTAKSNKNPSQGDQLNFNFISIQTILKYFAHDFEIDTYKIQDCHKLILIYVIFCCLYDLEIAYVFYTSLQTVSGFFLI